MANDFGNSGRVGASLADAFTQREIIPPKPGKHPLRNFDADRLAKVMQDPRFNVNTFGMTPQEYGMHLADLSGETIVDFQKAQSDPNSLLRQAQRTDLAAQLGSEGASMRLFRLPGMSGNAVASYLPEAASPRHTPHTYKKDEHIVDRLIQSLGRGFHDVIALSSIAEDTDIRHELTHRGIDKLKKDGFEIPLWKEEIIVRLMDYIVGDDRDKQEALWYFTEVKKMTLQEAFERHGDILKKIQKITFKELGGVPIPEPSPTK